MDQEGLERLKKFNAKMEWKKVANLITATATAAQGAGGGAGGGGGGAGVRQRHSDTGRRPANQNTMQQVQQAQQQQQKMLLAATVIDANAVITPGTQRIAQPQQQQGLPKRHASDLGVSATSMERAVKEEREEFIRQEEEKIRRYNEMCDCINSFKIGSSLFKCDLFMPNADPSSGGGSGGSDKQDASATGKKPTKHRFRDKLRGLRSSKSKDDNNNIAIIPTKGGKSSKSKMSAKISVSGSNSSTTASTNTTTTAAADDGNECDDILALAGVQGFAVSSK